MSVTTKTRRDRILASAYDAGQVQVKDLASQMTVSEATVRRDLRALADEGHLELVYGGATLPRASDFSLRSKSMRNVDAKSTIGRLAAELVRDNDQVFIDSGTTCLQLALHLRGRRGLSIINNSVRMATELGGHPDIHLIMVGGQYRAERMDTVGPLATATLEQLRGFVAFIGADGISRDFGVTASDIESAHLHRLAMRNAREAILLADSSKFRTPSLFKIADFEAISRVVTDVAPSAEWREFFNANGVEVICPEESAQPTTEDKTNEVPANGTHG
jgi:DeoR/GlpR family transcriptional regulator of sugar metabolism